MNPLYPIFIKLTDWPVLVIGAGDVARRKIRGLLGHGAQVRVVAMQAHESVLEWAQKSELQLSLRAFEDSDLDGARLVVVATNDTPLNERIAGLCNERGLLLNVVDVPHLCNFYAPSVVDRHPFQIAISTSGQSPALARETRRELEKQYPKELAGYVALLGEYRERAKREAPEAVGRVGEGLAKSEAWELWRNGNEKDALAVLERDYTRLIAS